jgi:hypothetical protein
LYCQNDPINRIDPVGLDAYLIFDPEGGPGFFEATELLGHVDVAVDVPDGRILVGSASWFGIDKPIYRENLYEASASGKKLVIRFKTQSLPWWDEDVNSDRLIYQYINERLAQGTIGQLWCSLFAQQALAYGGYQLGLLNGITSTWLWDSAMWYSKYSDNVSVVNFKKIDE